MSDATSQKNIVEKAKAGLVHKAEDVVDFTEKVLEFYNVQVLQTNLGNNGRKFVENEFYWEKTSEDLIELYETINK